jgi:hypothetical protein
MFYCWEPNKRFKQVNYFKRDISYCRHQVDMRTTNILRWKYKRKRLPARSMKSEKWPTGMSGKLSTRLLVSSSRRLQGQDAEPKMNEKLPAGLLVPPNIN